MAQVITLPRDVLVGRVLGGRYKLTNLIGCGSLGRVYHARHLMLERPLAVKVLHGYHQSDESLVGRFHREAQAASRIQHLNVVEVLDFGREEDGLLYIVMEYLDGRDLGTWIAEEGVASAERTVHWGSQLSLALAAAHHRGVLHRDIKPANVMVLRRASDEGAILEQIKVLDFGIAKIESREDGSAPLTMELVAGTPEFMSPEQCRGQPPDERSDIYACGCVLYFLCTGSPPFTAESSVAIVLKQVEEIPKVPSALNPGVTPALDAIIMRALEKNPEKRFQSARELRAALVGLPGSPVPIPSYAPEPTPEVSVDIDVAGQENPRGVGETGVFPKIPAEYAHKGRKSSSSDRRIVTIAGAVGLIFLSIVFGLPLLRKAMDEEGGRTARKHLLQQRSKPAAKQRLAPVPHVVAAVPEMPTTAPPPEEAVELKGVLALEEEPSPSHVSSRLGRRRSGIAHREPQLRSANVSSLSPSEKRPQGPVAAVPEVSATAPKEPTSPRAPSTGPEQSPPLEEASARPPEGSDAPRAVGTAPPSTSTPSTRPLRAASQITGLSVQGSLSPSAIRRALTRIEGRFPQCYASAATRAQRNASGQITVRLTIDESGHARDVRTNGNVLPGLDRCIAGAAQGIVSSQRPDVGTADVTFSVDFRP